MTTETPPPPGPPNGGFKDRESPLLDIVRAYSSGETDWPTTRSALLNFKYHSTGKSVAPESVTDPAYGEWYLDRATGDGPEPGTQEELALAAHSGLLDWDKYMEYLSASRGH